MRDIDNFNRLEEHAWRTEGEMAVIQRAQDGDASAQYQMGRWHLEGGALLVKKDRAKAAEWFRKAAEQGHADAKEQVRVMNNEQLSINDEE